MTLEVSGVGLKDIPVPLDEFPGLLKLDVSNNPLQHLGPTYNLRHTLEYLDVSGTQLFDLYDLTELRSLTHIFVNNIHFADTVDPLHRENTINDILANNPNLTHVGFSGLAISDFSRLFSHFSPSLKSLELSRTGLVFPPIPLDQFPHLQVLDLSHNPLEDLGPLYALQHQLQELDLSGTRVRNLQMLHELRALTTLRLNNIAFSEPQDPQIQNDILLAVLQKNPGLVHLAINGLELSDPYQLFNLLSPALEGLELSGLGLEYIPVPLEQYRNLTVLDLSNNPLDHVGPLFLLAETLSHVNLSGTRLHGLHDISELTGLTQLFLNNVAFEDNAPIEQELFDILARNPDLKHVGLNEIAVADHYALFNLLPGQLVSLEISNIGLNGAMIPLDRFNSLQKLDASHNGEVHFPLPPALHHTLAYLDVSGSRLFDLYGFDNLRALTHLYLNNVEFEAQGTVPEQDVLTVLANNPRLTHIGLNGLAFTDVHNLFSRFPPGLVSLELSNSNLEMLPVPIEQFTQLKVLDLSHNPLQHLGPLYVLHGTLEELDLSATELEDLHALQGLYALKRIRLNDIMFSAPQDPYAHGNIVRDLVNHNPGLIEVAINGLQIDDPYQLFDKLSPNLEVLEFSALGLTHIPVPLEQFAKLRVLNLSDNPLDHVGPLMNLHASLEHINLSGTQLHDLYELQGFTNLTHLWLNDVQFAGYLPPNELEQQVRNLIASNPRLSHVGLNGMTLQPTVLDELAMLPLVWLELAGTGLTDLYLPLPVMEGLRHLNLADNELTHTFGLEGASQLEHLNLANNALEDIANLAGGFPSLKVLNLLGNNAIPCANLQELEAALPPEVDYSGPTACASPEPEPEPEPEPTPYCSASASSSHYEWIDSVSLGGQLHVSGNNGGYADLAATTFSLQKGSTMPIRLNPGFNSGSYSETWRVWIDYNRDGNFSASEMVVSGVSYSSITGGVSVPVDAAVGTTRMRIAMRFAGSPAACGSYTWGEVEDYSVIISE